jgi:hypothetical protein
MRFEQEQILIAELDKPGYSADLEAGNYGDVASALNARTKNNNPVGQAQTPVQFTWSTFLALLSPSEILALYGYGSLAGDLKAALEANDRFVLASLWRAIKSALPENTVNDVQAAFAATEPDPNWSPFVFEPSIAQRLGLPAVTAKDVQSAYHKMSGI